MPGLFLIAAERGEQPVLFFAIVLARFATVYFDQYIHSSEYFFTRKIGDIQGVTIGML